MNINSIWNLLKVLPSKEPMFAIAEKRKGKVIVYIDKDGMPACINVKASDNARICSTCGNACIQYMVDDHGEYTCSACGKFPRELLQS